MQRSEIQLELVCDIRLWESIVAHRMNRSFHAAISRGLAMLTLSLGRIPTVGSLPNF